MRHARLYRYTIPVETGVILRHQRLKQREGLFIELIDGSSVGWGEIAPLPELSEENLAEAEFQTRNWIKLWCKGNEDSDWKKYAPSVAFGISCALAELQQRIGEIGNYQTVPLCYGDPDEMYHKLNQQSQSIAKLKVGLYEANRDGLIVDLLLEAMPHLRLRLDANRSWNLAKATQFANKIRAEYRHRIEFIEEPCQTPALSRQFSAQFQIALAWDESVRENGFSVQKEPNLAAIVIKPTLTGSIEKCIELIKQAHQQGIQAVISSSIESSLGLTQLARLAFQYTPETIPGLDTLNLMKVQLLRAWPDSYLPLFSLNSEYIQLLDEE